jgi:hypothetical protein
MFATAYFPKLVQSDGGLERIRNGQMGDVGGQFLTRSDRLI